MYNRLPAGTRTLLHQRIGERTERGYHNRTPEIAAALVIHFECSRDIPRAVQYSQQAALHTMERGGYKEGRAHATKGLALLESYPGTQESGQQGILLQLTLAQALAALTGEGSREVEQAYTQAWQLSQNGQNGNEALGLRALAGLWGIHFFRGALPIVWEYAEQIMAEAQPEQNPLLTLWGHHACGFTLAQAGDIHAARTHLDSELRLSHSLPLSDYGLSHMQSICQSYRALLLWAQGYADQAREETTQALAFAQDQAHPYGRAVTLSLATQCALVCRDEKMTQERAETLIALSREQAFPSYWALGEILRGLALTEQGQPEEGLAQMRQGLVRYRTTQTSMGLPGFLTHFAAAYIEAGQKQAGLTVLAEAEETMHRQGERLIEAELYRVKGELLLMQPMQEQGAKIEIEPESCFHKALEVAQRQGAKSLELRAAMSLGRLWQQQGKRKQAYELLSEIYDWFTEGFDTADLKEAKTLLEEGR